MLATGLMAGASGRVRILERTWWVAIAGLLVTAVVAAGGIGVSNLVLAQSAQDLIGRLAELEQRAPSPLPPDEILMEDASEANPDAETFAEFIGDFTGTKLALDDIADEARQLFIDADDADGAVADAIADVARSWVLLQNAFTYLEAWRSTDLTFPLDTVDGTDTATGADNGLTYAEIGLHIQIDAFERMLPAYDVLRRAESADAEQRALFDGRFEVMDQAHTVLLPNLHRALSLDTRQVFFNVDRFETNAPGVEARARVATYACFDRDAYLAVRDATPEQEAQVVALLAQQGITIDCLGLDNGNEVRPLGRP
ncbi:MAG TPA: hypothetical protein VGA69_08925 [Nitriliruptorales bacterium]